MDVDGTARSRVLYLLRHAKSSWSDDGLDDFDRPLAARGMDAVKRLRRYVTDEGVAPDLVLCSAARRTVMTLEGIAPAFPASTDVKIEDALYGASSERLLSRLHHVPDDVASVMLIGHNPGLETLAAVLIGGGHEGLREHIAEKFPTGALAVLSFDRRWRQLSPADATIEEYVVPREL